MADWFKESGIKSGDEIVIQVIDEENFVYRLIPEREFITKTQELQHRFDKSESEKEASEKVATLVGWVHLDKQEVVASVPNVVEKGIGISYPIGKPNKNKGGYTDGERIP
ncbi:MAG: hypothetical protein FJ005_08765 [Chloroflexi bacterium]|nr:hypothetical protein [Chloroflexota bacterium]